MKMRIWNERRVSVLALGTAGYGGVCSEGKAFDMLDAYAGIGGNLIDTARVYGESENVVGRWMQARGNREAIFLSTKGGHPRAGRMDIGRLSCGEIREDMAQSLEQLRTDHVDVYWLHRDDVSRTVGDIMETMQSLIDDGFARCVGASNWTCARIAEANDYAVSHGLTPFSANQPRFSLARQMTVEDTTLVEMDAQSYRMHCETGMICMAFSAQAKGFFSKIDALGEDALSDKVRRRFLYPENMEVYARLKRLQAETGLSVGALSLAWLTSQPFDVYPICGTSSVEQVLALAEAGDAELAPEQRDALAKVQN